MENIKRGSSWGELGVIIPNGRLSSSSDIKVRCPNESCHRKSPSDKPLSVNPAQGIGKCHRCGTRYIVSDANTQRRPTPANKPSFTPPSRRNLTALTDAGLSFFVGRKISQDALNYTKVIQGKNELSEYVIYPYIKDGVLVNFKARHVSEKRFTQSVGGMHIVWNHDNCKGKKDIIVTEGENDALAWITALYARRDAVGVCSVDSGAVNPNDTSSDRKLACITNSFDDVFEGAERIIISVDADAPGRKLQEELIRRFPAQKVYIANLGDAHKDANDFLMWEGIDKLIGVYESVQLYTPPGIYTVGNTMERLLDIYDHGLPLATSTHFSEVDQMWRWRPTEVTIWTGYNNEGKSTLLDQFSLVKSIADGWPVAAFPPENFPAELFFENLVHMLSGQTTDLLNEPRRLVRADYIKALDAVRDLFFLVHPKKHKTLDELFTRFDYLVTHKGVRIINIDPYNRLDHLLDNKRGDMYAADFMGRLSEYAKERSASINLVMHQKNPEGRDKSGNFVKPNLYNVKGGGTFADQADNVIVPHRPYRATDPTENTTLLYSDKIRFEKLVARKGVATLKFNWKEQRFYQVGSTAPVEYSPLNGIWHKVTGSQYLAGDGDTLTGSIQQHGNYEMPF
jgi:twinkle protein